MRMYYFCKKALLTHNWFPRSLALLPVCPLQRTQNKKSLLQGNCKPGFEKGNRQRGGKMGKHVRSASSVFWSEKMHLEVTKRAWISFGTPFLYNSGQEMFGLSSVAHIPYAPHLFFKQIFHAGYCLQQHILQCAIKGGNENQMLCEIAAGFGQLGAGISITLHWFILAPTACTWLRMITPQSELGEKGWESPHLPFWSHKP